MFSWLVQGMIKVKAPLPLRLSAWYLLASNLWGLMTSLVPTGVTVGWWDKSVLTGFGLPPAPPLPPDLAAANPISNFFLLLPYALVVISLVGILAAGWLLHQKFSGWILTVILMIPVFITAAINFSHQFYPVNSLGWGILGIQAAVFVYLLLHRRQFR